VPIALPPECLFQNMKVCRADFEKCLLEDPTDTPGVICPCYGKYSLCYRESGCFEMFPQAEEDYCIETLYCGRTTCLGGGKFGPTQSDGALAVGTGMGAVVALVVGTAAMLLFG
jgi:hypothetical protein